MGKINKNNIPHFSAVSNKDFREVDQIVLNYYLCYSFC